MAIKREKKYVHCNYTVGIVDRSGKYLSVDELSEKEAKDELCYYVEVIEHLNDFGIGVVNAVEDWRDGIVKRS